LSNIQVRVEDEREEGRGKKRRTSLLMDILKGVMFLQIKHKTKQLQDRAKR
jgi:hypothetical protein